MLGCSTHEPRKKGAAWLATQTLLSLPKVASNFFRSLRVAKTTVTSNCGVTWKMLCVNSAQLLLF